MDAVERLATQRVHLVQPQLHSGLVSCAAAAAAVAAAAVAVVAGRLLAVPAVAVLEVLLGVMGLGAPEPVPAAHAPALALVLRLLAQVDVAVLPHVGALLLVTPRGVQAVLAYQLALLLLLLAPRLLRHRG